MHMELEVREVGIEVILELRTRVLRPHFPEGKLAHFDGDDADTASHWAAFDGAGGVVGCVSYMERPSPESVPRHHGEDVQLRGMATAPEVQRQGVGRRVLDASMGVLALRYPGARVWCNARTSAQGFYEGAGFVPFGVVFEKPDIGSHVVMAVDMPIVLA